jgi:sulfatase maturation enzyme AslB (radical SAM superfamily)
VGGGKNLDTETVCSWIKNWCGRIVPENFIIMGGEPTLNKNLISIIESSAKLWRLSTIKIITNGYFLKNHPDLPRVINEHNAVLEISLKSDDPEYLKQIEPIKDLVSGWVSKFKINVVWRKDHKNWLRVYNGYGPDIMPFEDNDPEKSYEVCGQKVCRVLHNGCIWKCPRLAYLHTYKFKLHSSWDYYLKYKPLGPQSTFKQIKNFFETKAIPECSMCPARKHRMELPLPIIKPSELINVKTK